MNDRPYVASSFLSVAHRACLPERARRASRERPKLVEAAIPLEATISASALPWRRGSPAPLFEPLGYALDDSPLPLDPAFSAWGESRYFRVSMRAERKLSELLTHLYVLVPVLDDEKHYFVGDDEVEKLLRHGEGWLADAPGT